MGSLDQRMDRLERSMCRVQRATETQATLTGIIRSFETKDQKYVLGEIEQQGGVLLKFEILGELTPQVFERAFQAYTDKESVTVHGILLKKGTDREPVLDSSGQVKFEMESYIEIDHID